MMASPNSKLAVDEQIAKRVAYLERQCQQFANLESAFERIGKLESGLQRIEREVQQIKTNCNGQKFRENDEQGIATTSDSSACEVQGEDQMCQINKAASLDGI